ncbi:DUF1444 family protein [Terrarubrum flagellatum]|uniref:DUF1444 family protein n=1 Tax=Terrirubrum flagellatum TaxID=2895980 RepID=UPI003144F4CD
MGRRAFVEEVARIIRAESPATTVKVLDDFEINVVTPSGRSLVFPLSNAYAHYRKNQADLMEIARKHLSLIAAPPANESGLDRKRVVPVVKDRGWLKGFEEAQRRMGGTPQPALFEELNKDLIIVYAEDTPKRMRYLTDVEFDAIGVERAELRKFAKQNLLPLMGKIMIAAGDGFAMVSAGGGDYDSSLLLFDDIWTGGQIKVKGEIVVAIPARDKLFVTGSLEPTRLAQTRAAATNTLKESAYPLTDRLFVYRKGRFELFDSP